MKASTRDSVIYYWSTRSLRVFLSVLFLCTSFWVLISGKLHEEIYKDYPHSIHAKHQKKNYKSMQGY